VANVPRPGAVTAIAILNLIVGGFGLLGCLCGCGSIGGMSYLLATSTPPAGQPDPRQVFLVVDRAYPLSKWVIVGSMIAGLLVMLLLLVSGIGLLRLRSWGRKLAIATALFMIGLNVIDNVYAMVQGNAAVMKITEEYQRFLQELAKSQPGAAPPMIGLGGRDSAPISIMNVSSIFVENTYPILLIWIMMLKSIRRAFAGEAPLAAPRKELDRGWGDAAD